ncbi:hypothetical protein [Microbacterium sp. NPDC087591]|uniref:hypothetical protein n=1 Tax=Microbacterium sp. NPDC087591 TaxID=3364192 RepID=UPI0037F47095
MKALLLGARGAVGTVIRRELELAGHTVTAASRAEAGGVRLDLRGELAPFTALAADHDVVINASGIERPELATAAARTPLVDISATGSYLAALRDAARGPVVLGAGLAPGLTTVLAAALDTRPHDEIDVLVMLGSGEKHGPAAVAWTAGLVGADIHLPPDTGKVRNFRTSVRAEGPDGRTRRYLRADFPDHILLAPTGAPVIRSYLTLGSAVMTASLDLVGRLPVLRGVLSIAPHVGSDDWHVVTRNRRTGERREAAGSGQSEATGRLTALAAVRIAGSTHGAVTMADLVSADEVTSLLSSSARPSIVGR